MVSDTEPPIASAAGHQCRHYHAALRHCRLPPVDNLFLPGASSTGQGFSLACSASLPLSQVTSLGPVWRDPVACSMSTVPAASTPTVRPPGALQILRIHETTESHSGYEFPWSPWHLFWWQGGAAFHDFHHTRNVDCYGWVGPSGSCGRFSLCGRSCLVVQIWLGFSPIGCCCPL